MSRRCASLEHLHSAWVDAELRGRERAALAAHLQRCPPCRASIAELRVTQAMLRSLPARNLVVDVTGAGAPSTRRRQPVLLRLAARTLAAVVFLVGSLGVAAFAVGSAATPDRQVAVPVDVFVADHLVRAIGGPVSTPALLDAPP
jgi:anti-sigma factor RsiW